VTCDLCAVRVRVQCILAQMRLEGSLSDEHMSFAVQNWISKFCCRIGELYENRGRYRSAIPWYERCCEISAGGCFGPVEEANDLSNLGVAQKRAGLLRDALRSYDASLQVAPDGTTAASNRQALVREMRHWTGERGVCPRPMPMRVPRYTWSYRNLSSWKLIWRAGAGSAGTAVEHDFDDAEEDEMRQAINARSSSHEQLGHGYFSAVRRCRPSSCLCLLVNPARPRPYVCGSQAQEQALPRDRQAAMDAAMRRGSPVGYKLKVQAQAVYGTLLQMVERGSWFEQLLSAFVLVLGLAACWPRYNEAEAGSIEKTVWLALATFCTLLVSRSCLAGIWNVTRKGCV
jgi:hypothetical protein